MNQPPEHHRAIRSFVRRNGRTTAAQARALAQHSAHYVLPFAPQALDARAVFGRDAPLVFEIGFGMGEATAHIAHALPECNFLCCEVHEPGIGALLQRMAAEQLQHIRICAHDAVQVAQHMIAPESLHGVHIFFPDPWHKKRHHKRRLVQAAFVELLAQRLRPGGYIHCATDWEPYAQHMLEVLGNCALLGNASADAQGWAQRPAYRPVTKFERRGLRLGHGVRDLVFVRAKP